jgi:hypothetical protein
MAQAVEHLCSKYRALCSIPTTGAKLFAKYYFLGKVIDEQWVNFYDMNMPAPRSRSRTFPNPHQKTPFSLYISHHRIHCYDFFFFLVVSGFELRVSHLLGRPSTTWATPSAIFCIGYFWDRVSGTICLGWPCTAVFLISVSWVHY